MGDTFESMGISTVEKGCPYILGHDSMTKSHHQGIGSKKCHVRVSTIHAVLQVDTLKPMGKGGGGIVCNVLNAA